MRRQFQYDPDIGYRYIQNLKIRIPHEAGGYLYKTNSIGFRSDTEFEKNYKRKKRAILFGDSYTAGDGVSNGERYSDILERNLENFEIYNFAIPGTGTDQQYLTWKKFAKDIDYDLLILGIQVENIRRITVPYRQYKNLKNEIVLVPKPFFKIVDEKLELFNTPVPREYIPSKSDYKLKSNLIEKGGDDIFIRNFIKRFGTKAKDFMQKISNYQPLKEYEKNNNSSWRLMESILKKWSSEINKPIIIFPIPTYHYIEKLASAKSYQKKFNSLKKENQIYIVDPLKDFHKYPTKELRQFRFEIDDHPSQKAHIVLADALFKFIKKIEIF